jgi:hypothetical protein
MLRAIRIIGCTSRPLSEIDERGGDHRNDDRQPQHIEAVADHGHFQRRFRQHDLDEVACPHAGLADHPDDAPVRGPEDAERVPDQLHAQGKLVADPARAFAGAKIEGVIDLRGCVGWQHQATLVAALEGHGAHLRGAQQLGAQLIRQDAPRDRLGSQRGELSGGEAVVQPADAEVGDGGHEDQHLGQHHERDGEEQQLGGQAKAAPFRRCRQRRPDALDPFPQSCRPGQRLIDAIAWHAPASLAL